MYPYPYGRTLLIFTIIPSRYPAIATAAVIAAAVASHDRTAAGGRKGSSIGIIYDGQNSESQGNDPERPGPTMSFHSASASAFKRSPLMFRAHLERQPSQVQE
ncbi:hypothetical protein GY45DRAFT_557208 [Cubamyces sp. BRFM 1775]|nr:hypothetical protein GY45DRAFT_557208 [Cubamyces sp. BRFM 1775]